MCDTVVDDVRWIWAIENERERVRREKKSAKIQQMNQIEN